MYAVARQGRLASRALRLIPSSSPSSISYLPRLTPLVFRNAPLNHITKHKFSSISQFRYNNAYAEEVEEDGDPADASDLGAEDISDANREFTKFSELGEAGVIDPVVIDTLVNKMGIHTMTEVQRMTINECLDGTDVIAQAKTGTGKTLAFLMPIIQRLLGDSGIKTGSRRAQIGDTQALIISPTRELAEQIAVEAKKITQNTGVKVQTAVGGTQKSLHLRLMQSQGCHILVGTPGRVKDLLSDPYSGVTMANIKTFVLDEADRLLDIGFGPDIEEIQSYMPERSQSDRQTLMFSATIPKSVVGIVKSTMKPNFKFVRTVDPNEAATHETIPQKTVFLPGLQNQIPALVEVAQNAIEDNKRDPESSMPFKAIVFYNSVAEVHMAHEVLSNMRDPGQSRGGLFSNHPLAPCQIIVMSSQLDQRERSRNSDAFRRAKSAILISSDVTARGMDFPNVSHVIQMGLPRSSDDYVHRVGRTGRAGKSGTGYLFLQQDEGYEVEKLKRRNHIKDFTEERLSTSELDMTKPSQLTPEIARIMQMVETGVKNTNFRTKAKAYNVMLSALGQSGGRSKQEVVDLVNDCAKYGWGLQEMPVVSPVWVQKSGFSRTEGLRINDAFQNDRSDDQFGGNGRFNRGGFGNRDSSGFGGRGGRDGGRGFDRGFRGGGGRGGDRGGFGRGDDNGF
ncbi:hypothetical protein LTR84_000686 [Exophiala bonariae]|uniref:ATP-dependent RNA helicase n=1 Tax=Exophiala bonariae TaxID=1690606 RepID=A0AAV9NUR8_9EURO|nr:hypothetical protein LTR84_000686 [Exophiala bonariae]